MSQALDRTGRDATRARIDADALAANLREAQRLAEGRRVIAVVKADAYGHGAVPVARRLVAEGADALAVATLAEALELRAAGIAAPLLVLGGVADAEQADAAVANELVPVLHDEPAVAWLRAAARARSRRAAVEMEVDTGMARLGVPEAALPRLLARLADAPELQLAGVFTHLACADAPELASARDQLRRFTRVLEAVRGAGAAPRRVHVANSAALLASPDLAGDLPREVNAVRPGLMLYGIHPAPHLEPRADLQPVMTLETRIAALRPVRGGDPVGYGESWRAPADGLVATLPVGYADGVPWALGSRGFAWQAGRRLHYAGRVSMDLVTLFVPDARAQVGDRVVLFGATPDGGRLRVEELAAAAGTLPYELVVRVGRRIPRVAGGAGSPGR